MGKKNVDLPTITRSVLYKTDVLTQLKQLDDNVDARNRILQMETEFRRAIDIHIKGLLGGTERLSAYKTNPFVLLMYCYKNHYSQISQIEGDIPPAKLFSSMETSAGKMAEIVTFPIYGWNIASSSMHSADSALDGWKLEGDILKLVTLKSGPRCLNDEMSENFADAIINNAIG